jgi:hypothetical protein
MPRTVRLVFALAAVFTTVGVATVGAGDVVVVGATGDPDSAAIEIPDSIDGSGRVDVSAALTEFLAALPDGATVRMPASTRYRVDAGLEIRDARDLTIRGEGATLFAPDDGAGADPPTRPQRRGWPRSRRLLTIANSRDVWISGLSLQGPNTGGASLDDLEGQAGLFVAQSTNIYFNGVAVRDVWGDGVTVVGASRGVYVSNSVFDHIGRQGVAVTNATDVVVESNRFDHVARSVFDVEPVRAWRAERIVFHDNDIGDYENFVLAAVGGGANVTDIDLTRNRITAGRGLTVFAGFVKQPRSGLTITDNESSVAATPALGATPIRITNYSNVTIADNVGPVADGLDAIALNAVCDPIIESNEWPGAEREIVEIVPCGSTPDTTPLAEDGTTAPGPAAATSAAGAGSTPASGATSDSRSTSTSPWLIAAICLLLAAVIAVAAMRARSRRHPDVSASSDPASSDPASSDPASSDPASSDPASSDPASSDPATPGSD